MSSRATTITCIACILIVTGVMSLLYFCDPAQVAIYPICPFHIVTGLQCPGCGSLRAMHQLLHGHPVAALRLNPVFVLSLPVLAGVAFRFLHRRRHGKPGIGLRPVWLWLFVATWLGFGIVRNLPVF